MAHHYALDRGEVSNSHAFVKFFAVRKILCNLFAYYSSAALVLNASKSPGGKARVRTPDAIVAFQSTIRYYAVA